MTAGEFIKLLPLIIVVTTYKLTMFTALNMIGIVTFTTGKIKSVFTKSDRNIIKHYDFE